MLNKETLCALGEGECLYEASISPPIFQTSTFGGGGDYSYTRCSNPTRSALERALAVLEGGKHGFAFSSGLGAINALFSILKNGDRVIVSDDLYGGTYRLITKIYQNFGIDFVFTDMTDPENVANAINSETALVFAESPTNPMMKIIPLSKIAEICKEKNILFAVDNTFLTPYFQNPLSLGADIVIHSATKFLSGHHDTVSGAIVTNSDSLAEQFRMVSMTLGNMLSPFESWLVLRGIRTLPLRMEKHQENSLKVAEFLSGLPEVEAVIYPGLDTHPGKELCLSQSSGFGGVVSFTVRDVKYAKRLIKGGKIIKFAESLGGFRSLITYPITQTHASVPKEKREALGITDRLLRLSVGLENIEDIKNDLVHSLHNNTLDKMH